MLQTKKEDWKVKITGRRDAEYSEKLELVSFEFAYQGGTPEQLKEVPFERGAAEDDLLAWLSEAPYSTSTMEI